VSRALANAGKAYAWKLANLDFVNSRPKLRFIYGGIGYAALVASLLHEVQLELLQFAVISQVDCLIEGPAL